MNRLAFEDLTPYDIEPPPVEQDDDLLPGRRAFVHTPITTDQLASTIKRAMDDAERASLAAAEAAHSRGNISQREVVPGSGVFSLTRGRVA